MLTQTHTETNCGFQVPNGAYGHFLLGRIATLSNRHEKAISHFERCLLLNPMMWSAFEELCSLGTHPDTMYTPLEFSNQNS